MKTKSFIATLAFAFFGIAGIQAQDKDSHAGHDHSKMEKAEAKTATAFACPMKCEGDKTYAKAGECPKCGMALTKQEVKAESKAFYCTMKCEGDKTYDKAGECPKCGMTLVEKKTEQKKDDHSGHDH